MRHGIKLRSKLSHQVSKSFTLVIFLEVISDQSINFSLLRLESLLIELQELKLQCYFVLPLFHSIYVSFRLPYFSEILPQLAYLIH